MTRYLTKWALVLVLAGVGWGLTSGTARAQYFGGFRPGVNPLMARNLMFGNPWMNPYMGTTGTYSFFNPYTGGVFSYQYPAYPLTYGYSFFNPYTGRVMDYQVNANVPYSPFYGYGGGYGGYSAMPYVPSAYNGSGTAGSYARSANPVINEQLRLLHAASYQQAGYTSTDKGGNGYSEPKAANPPRKAAGNAGTPVPVDPSLVTARDADVLSGKVLNELAAAIRGLEAKGNKADSALLPPELVTKLAYQGGPAADVLAASQGGGVAFPAALAHQDFAQVRADLEQPANAVLEPLAVGKKVDPAAADKLAAAATSAKAAVAAKLISRPADEAADVNRFLDRLAAVAKAAKDPALNGAVVPKWASLGATVAEVVKQLEKFKLTFAPAPAGSEDAYFALYRGLVGYYTGLAQGK
jgi:hypothetical protein